MECLLQFRFRWQLNLVGVAYDGTPTDKAIDYVIGRVVEPIVSVQETVLRTVGAGLSWGISKVRSISGGSQSSKPSIKPTTASRSNSLVPSGSVLSTGTLRQGANATNGNETILSHPMNFGK